MINYFFAVLHHRVGSRLFRAMRESHALHWLLAIAWPYIYLAPYTGNMVGIGNDFKVIYYDYKLYLLDSLARYNFPFWSPSEAAGFPFYCNPLPQPLYPLNILLVLFYKVLGGYSAFDHQLFTIGGISIFACGLYAWLRSLRIDTRPALFATLVMATSFKVTEIIRFPNAVHAMAWFPWILFSLTRIRRASRGRDFALYGSLLVFSLFSLFTAGYPYYIFYAPFLIVPYGLLLIIPGCSRYLIKDSLPPLLKPLTVMAAAGTAAVAAAAPYLYAMGAMLSQTTDRAGANFAYSTVHLFDGLDTLGSLLYPPAAQAEGWYYFGICGLVLILVYVFAGAKETRQRPLALPIVLLVWIAAISYITYGRKSYLFSLIWHHLPFYSSLRVWGRMNIILVPLIAWLLAEAYAFFEYSLDTQRRHTKILSISCAAIGGIQLFLFVNHVTDIYWTEYFVKIKSTVLQNAGINNSFFSLYGLFYISATIATFIVFLIVFRCSAHACFRSVSSKYVLLFSLVSLSAFDTFSAGPWMWVARPQDTVRTAVNIHECNRQSFMTPRIDGYLTIQNTAQFSVGTVANWYFARYLQFRSQSASEPSAVRKLLGIEDGQKIFISRQVTYARVQDYLDDAGLSSGTVRVVSYTGDSLVLEVSLGHHGFVSFIDNWAPGWYAAVDGRNVPMHRLFGTFKSVAVPSGNHRVQFEYRPGL